jgi:hypothetical protein
MFNLLVGYLAVFLLFTSPIKAQAGPQAITYDELIRLLRVEAPEQVQRDIGHESCVAFTLTPVQRDSLTFTIVSRDPSRYQELSGLFRFLEQIRCPTGEGISNPLLTGKRYWAFSAASYEDLGYGEYGAGVERTLVDLWGWEIVSGLRVAWGDYIVNEDSVRFRVSHTRMAVDAKLRGWIVPSNSDFGAYSQFGVFLQSEGFASNFEESRSIGLGIGSGLGMGIALNSEIIFAVDAEAHLYWRGGLRRGFSDQPHIAVPLRVVLLWFP